MDSDDFRYVDKISTQIVELYKDRTNRQADISRIMNISIEDVRGVTQAYNYSHGIQITSENRREGQFIKPCVFLEELAFLLPYRNMQNI